MLDKDSTLEEILGYIDCETIRCEIIRNYFILYPDIRYEEIIIKVESILSKEPRAGGYILGALSGLAEYNVIEINDKLIVMLLNNQLAGYIQVLNLWRKIKDLNNISDFLKSIVISNVKGRLPLIEVEDEWTYTNLKGETING